MLMRFVSLNIILAKSLSSSNSILMSMFHMVNGLCHARPLSEVLNLQLLVDNIIAASIVFDNTITH